MKLVKSFRICVVMAVAAALLCGCRKPGTTSGPGYPPTRQPSQSEWRYPTGTPDEMARTMTVQQLIDAWRNFPKEESKLSMHAEYAKALARFGPGALAALPDLIPYATHENLYLRQGAMEALAAIRGTGIDYLAQALQYKDPAGKANVIDIHWDAAIALSKVGPDAAPAIPALLAAIISAEENVNVKQDAAAALANIGAPAIPAMRQARDHLYSLNGLSPSEVGVLRTLNIALQGLGAM